MRTDGQLSILKEHVHSPVWQFFCLSDLTCVFFIQYSTYNMCDFKIVLKNDQ